MQWSMPRPVLQIVAGLLVAVAVFAFGLGAWNAPQRGRLPGERAAGQSGPAAVAVEAPEATPLSQERIEGPPAAVELTPEEKAKQEADKLAKAQTVATAKVAAAQPTAVAPPPTPTPTLQTAEPAMPPAEEAPH